MKLKDMGIQAQQMIREQESPSEIDRVQPERFRADLVTKYGSGIVPFLDKLQKDFGRVAMDMMVMWSMPWEEYLGGDYADATWDEYLRVQAMHREVPVTDGNAA